MSVNIESVLSSFDLKAYGQTEGGKVGSERVIEVEDCLSIESAVPFERVIQVQVCLTIESGLSAFYLRVVVMDLKGLLILESVSVI